MKVTESTKQKNKLNYKFIQNRDSESKYKPLHRTIKREVTKNTNKDYANKYHHIDNHMAEVFVGNIKIRYPYYIRQENLNVRVAIHQIIRVEDLSFILRNLPEDIIQKMYLSI